MWFRIGGGEEKTRGGAEGCGRQDVGRFGREQVGLARRWVEPVRPKRVAVDI